MVNNYKMDYKMTYKIILTQIPKPKQSNNSLHKLKCAVIETSDVRRSDL